MARVTEVAPLGKRKSPTRELIETILTAIVLALAVRTWVVEVYLVDGVSMENTLHNDERVLVNKFIYRWGRQPETGDMIVFRSPHEPDRDFVKRVVALAGDKVAIRAGKVYVNGQVLPEAPSALVSTADEEVKLVPPDSVWVLGDNRNNSQDSRAFGEVPLTNIRGLAFFRIWPLTRFCWFANPVRAGAGDPGGFMTCR